MPRTSILTVMTAALALLAAPSAGHALAAGERAEEDMLAAINAARAQNGLYALNRSSSLTGSARRFSSWLMENDRFGHQSRIRASGDFAMLGEALAMHTGHRFRVGWTVSRWLGSPSHRSILLSRTMRWFGAGVTRGRFGASPATMWVLHTGRLQPPGVQVPQLPLP